jgi:serine/threonine kinase 17
MLGWPRDAGRYAIHETIGAGNFAVVRRAVDRDTGRLVAVKTMPKRRHETSRLVAIRREVDMLQETRQCPQIVSLLDVYEDDTYAHVVTELLPGASRAAELGVDDATLREVASILLTAATFCHDRRILIGDIKPANIVHNKVVDLGAARQLDASGEIQRPGGTAAFAAPEALFLRRCGLNADLYAIGATLIMLATASRPHPREVGFSRYWTRHPALTPGAQDLVERLVRINPRSRGSAAEAMQHAWITQWR